MNRNKRFAKAALWIIVLGTLLVLAPGAASAAQGEELGSAEHATFLTTDGARKLGGAIGVGLVVMGGAAGIGRVGGSAVESMARQPEAAPSINTAMIITAAMIEGATLFAVLVGLLAAF